MSDMAPFSDAAVFNDPTNFSYTFINYYPYGAAIALALDLNLRERSGGRMSLDDFMRAMWKAYGKPGGRQPGLVGNPYTLKDLRDRLAEVSGDRAFADEFFDKYVEGREVPDYARLLAPAGLTVRRRGAGVGWLGAAIDASGKVTALVPWGSPAFTAGLEKDDVITSVDGAPFSGDVLKTRKPGDRVTLEIKRESGRPATLTATFGEDPSFEAVLVEAEGGTLTPEQRAFRQAWLGSKKRE
jgi:predicted metalloprotease with PDZ domain